MAISEQDFQFVQKLVHARAGLCIETGKERAVELRLDPIARQEGFGSVNDFVAHLRLNPFCAFNHKVVEAMTTSETLFFRDARPFEVLATHVIPELIKQRAAERCLTFWCAASSSGQEPYSVVMLLREHFSQLSSWNVRFIASDLSTEMLARAIQGRYSELEVNRGLPAHLRVKYFKKSGAEWRIQESVRRSVEFRELNLSESWSFLPKSDVIFLRNVLIYLDAEVKRDILGRARQLLKPGGFLLLGSSESTVNLDDSFEPLPISGSSCFQVRNGR
ncbi:MAG: CheR family methyltransferase [Terriglobia bacterium]